jgi:hypothetical protein
MWLVVGVKSICDEDSPFSKNQKRIKLLNWTNQKKKKRIKLRGRFEPGDESS